MTLRRLGWLAGAFSILFALGTGAAAQTNATPLSNASVQQLVELLADPSSAAKAFRRTAAPDRSGFCPEVGRNEAGATKGLEIVGYRPDAGADRVPRVDLAIRFGTNNDSINDADQTQLDNLAKALNSPELEINRFVVAGHTDATGSNAVNRELSCARSLAVRSYLIRRGVAAERLSAYGFGSSRPLENTTGKSEVNRRVEIRRE